MSCKIVFMGTPDFAVPCLQRLLQDGYDVAGVFSQPDRPKGRGYKMTPPPVKELALQQDIPVYQPTKMRDGEALEVLQALQPDLVIVVAYGRILPPELLAVPRFGCVNVHASLLPVLRGAAPIQWAILNGEKITGVTTMLMDEGLDTGDILLTAKTPIGAEETAGELFSRLSHLGAECLSKTIPLLLDGNVPRTKQNHAFATYAPPLQKSMAHIDYNKTAQEICRLVRGLHPAPAARTRLDNKIVKVLEAKPGETRGAPGTVVQVFPLQIACQDGCVELITVQPEGKQPMPGADFARGKHLVQGVLFE